MPTKRMPPKSRFEGGDAAPPLRCQWRCADFGGAPSWLTTLEHLALNLTVLATPATTPSAAPMKAVLMESVLIVPQ